MEAFYPIIFANYLSDPAKVAALIASPGGSGGGGGGGSGGGGGGGEGAAEAKEEEKEEEEEAEIGGMFTLTKERASVVRFSCLILPLLFVL